MICLRSHSQVMTSYGSVLGLPLQTPGPPPWGHWPHRCGRHSPSPAPSIQCACYSFHKATPRASSRTPFACFLCSIKISNDEVKEVINQYC